MKRVFLLRHAKSDWDANYDSDHERPLNKRGRAAARLVGRFLSAFGQQPDLIITSTAVRARRTVELATESGGWDCPVTETRDLYHATPEILLHHIQSQNGSLEKLLLAGHEPTWSETASELIGGGGLKFPTATVARIDFRVDDWKQIEFGGGTLAWLVTPKLLRRIGFEA